jgi:mannose-6-phosphate isomerase-like protein (cupin superfamily)
MHVANLSELEPFTTLDGSTIRELAGPAWTPARNQSLAEASVPVRGATTAHYHRLAEELYYFVAGSGRLKVGEAERDVSAGDCAVIPPGVEHKLWNTGGVPLVLLCCCAPAYSHEDTVLTEPEPARRAESVAGLATPDALVDRAPDAEPGRRGQQRQRGDEPG